MNKNIDKIIHMVIIFLILVIALVLRLYNFRQGEVLVSSDEVYAFEIAAKPVYGVLSGNSLELATQLFRYFNYPWGWTSLIGTTIVTFILVLFHIPITEFTINIASIFIGLLSISSLYLLCVVITEKRLIAFFSALIFAILPIHVALSRSVTVNNMYSTTLFFLTLFFFINYFKKSEEEKKHAKKYVVLGMLSLGFYLGADNQFPGILPILFVSGLLFDTQKNIFRRIIGTLQTFLNKYLFLFFCVNLPLIFGTIYLAQKGLVKSSYLNLFHSKALYLGFYYHDFLRALYDDAGPVLMFTFVISFIYNFICIFWKKEQRKERIFLFFWFSITAFPWLFLLSSKIAWFQLYIMQPLSCLVIVSAFFFHDIFEQIKGIRQEWFRRTTITISVLILSCILIFTLASMSNLVYKTNYFGWQFTPVFGQVGENIGIKTIGYYVREQTSNESTIFVDVESFVGEYYLHRKIIGDLDLTEEQIYNQLLSLIEKEKQLFEYAFIHENYFGMLGPVLEMNDYYVSAIAVDAQGKAIARLYETKNKKNNETQIISTPIILQVNKYDELFNQKYGTLDELYIDYGE